MINAFYYMSESTDIYENLAMEETLASFASKLAGSGLSVVGLFLWQNNDAVIIGRHQVMRNECDMSLAITHGTQIARRKTGGGAVYHDMGNLCFSFISSNDIFSRDVNFEILLECLSRLGISAEVTGRNDICVDGKKISGNAYSQYELVQLHHGTLLVELDISYATDILTPNKGKLVSKGISSVKSRIMNLSDINKNISVGSLTDCIHQSFVERYCNAEFIQVKLDDVEYRRALYKLKSDEWLDREALVHGRTVEGKYGRLCYNIELTGERIENIFYETDIINAQLIEYMMSSLKGTLFDEERIIECYKRALMKYPYLLNESEVFMLNEIITSIIDTIE